MSPRSGPLADRPDDEDRVLDQSLRPQTFAEYVGQSHVKQNLEVAITAARQRGDVLEHLLFHGPPGLGKTSLAHLVAREMGSNLRATSGPAVERAGDLAAILSNLDHGDVLFIDEIHRLHRVIEEMLYPAMEDYRIDLVVGQGPGATNVRLDLKPFTLVGATTRAGLLSSPLRSRFGHSFRVEFYDAKELGTILARSARLLGVELEPEGAAEIANRSRGTPRIANRLLRRVRDYAQVRADGIIRRDVAQEALRFNGVDESGFDEMDRRLLLTIIDKFSGGPVGIGTLAASIGEERDTIVDVYEPYLLQEGFLARTPKGRVATSRAYRHLGRDPGKGSQGGFF